MLRVLGFVMVLATGLVLFSCADSRADGPKPGAKVEVLPESYWLATAPAAALDIKKANEVAENGKDITVVGRVGDLSDERAWLKLIDKSFLPCNERTSDSCKTPWDYCCEDATTLSKGSVSIEFREGDRLRKVTPKGFHGLDHLKEIVVTGKAIKDPAGNIIVVASGMHVKP